MENFGAWLLNKLQEKNMSQSELARRSSLSEGTISNIISSSRGTGIDSIEAIAHALRIPPDEVFLAAIGKPLKPDDEWVKEGDPKRVNSILLRLCKEIVITPDYQVTVHLRE